MMILDSGLLFWATLYIYIYISTCTDISDDDSLTCDSKNLFFICLEFTVSLLL